MRSTPKIKVGPEQRDYAVGDIIPSGFADFYLVLNGEVGRRAPETSIELVAKVDRKEDRYERVAFTTTPDHQYIALTRVRLILFTKNEFGLYLAELMGQGEVRLALEGDVLLKHPCPWQGDISKLPESLGPNDRPTLPVLGPVVDPLTNADGDRPTIRPATNIPREALRSVIPPSTRVDNFAALLVELSPEMRALAEEFHVPVKPVIEELDPADVHLLDSDRPTPSRRPISGIDPFPSIAPYSEVNPDSTLTVSTVHVNLDSLLPVEERMPAVVHPDDMPDIDPNFGKIPERVDRDTLIPGEPVPEKTAELASAA